jgi:periplasmic protein TonB
MDLEPTGVSEEVIVSLKSCLVEGDPEQQRRERKIRRRALVFSIAIQSAFVAALVLFPLLGKSERISLTDRWTILPPYAPLGAVRQHGERTNPPPGGKKICIVCFNQNLSPTIKPGEKVDTTLDEPAGEFVPGAPTGPSAPGGLGLNSASKLPEPPKKEPRVETTKRLKITTLEPAMLMRRVEPVYPPLAKQTRREGRVELRAIISTDGSIQSLEVLSGDPLFLQSALAAVREWRYRPTYLNGQAAEVDTHITVIYTLNH